ncbi:MAG: hypothetical protein IPL08_09635 [Saprospiraceae bacterium]|nr:hypothetical protein [Saprospiraceae bacterium]
MRLLEGGVDGLLYIQIFRWGRINHPNEYFLSNQKINVVALDFGEEKEFLSGLKRLTP